MTSDRIVLSDQDLLSLYAKFRDARRSSGELRPQARYDDFIAHGRYQGSALPAPIVAQHHVLDIANAVNRFHYDLHSLEVWRKIIGSITESEKTQALFEFIFPLASHTLSAPYSVKQKLISSIYQISYHTNRFIDKSWKESSAEKHVNFLDAKRVAEHFRSWSSLECILSNLNDQAFVNSSENYRNRFHHGFPAGIESGDIITVEQVAPGSSSYKVRILPPLLLEDVVPLMTAQYDAALQSHIAYIELIKEQEKHWPK